MTTTRSAEERGAALVVAILVLAILTVIGIALMLITSTETRIAANEWSINRGFYASDAGVRWGTAEMHMDPRRSWRRPEFGTKAAPELRRQRALPDAEPPLRRRRRGFIGNRRHRGARHDPGPPVRGGICFGCQGNAPGEKAPVHVRLRGALHGHPRTTRSSSTPRPSSPTSRPGLCPAGCPSEENCHETSDGIPGDSWASRRATARRPRSCCSS